MRALLEVRHRPVLPAHTRAELLEDAFLARLPVPSTSIFKHAVELLLRLPPALFNCGNKVLFVCMAEVARDISVLERLEGRKGGLGVQMCDRVCECRSVDMSLRQEVISSHEFCQYWKPRQ